MPKVSVIMSTYNDNRYIRESVRSILTQSFRDFEFIIIDDASTDDTVSIIKEFGDPRIKLFVNEENRGLTVNLNAALERSSGEYIARMDGDDISHPDRLEKQVKYLDEYPGCSLAGTAVHNFGASDLYWRLPDDSSDLKIRMLIRPVFAHPSFMFRRSLVDEGLKYDESYRTAQDYDFASRVAKEHGIGRLPQVLLEYRTHEKQISNTAGSNQKSNADRVRDRLLGELGVTFTNAERRVYNAWVAERKPAIVKGYKMTYVLIDKICSCNSKSRIYDEEMLPVVLKKMLYTWVIRSRDIKYVLSFPYICGFSPANMALFVGEIMRTVKEKVMNKRKK